MSLLAVAVVDAATGQMLLFYHFAIVCYWVQGASHSYIYTKENFIVSRIFAQSIIGLYIPSESGTVQGLRPV